MNKIEKIKLKLNNIVNNIKKEPDLLIKITEVIEKGKTIYHTIRNLPKEKDYGQEQNARRDSE